MYIFSLILLLSFGMKNFGFLNGFTIFLAGVASFSQIFLMYLVIEVQTKNKKTKNITSNNQNQNERIIFY